MELEHEGRQVGASNGTVTAGADAGATSVGEYK